MVNLIVVGYQVGFFVESFGGSKVWVVNSIFVLNGLEIVDCDGVVDLISMWFGDDLGFWEFDVDDGNDDFCLKSMLQVINVGMMSLVFGEFDFDGCLCVVGFSVDFGVYELGGLWVRCFGISLIFCICFVDLIFRDFICCMLEFFGFEGFFCFLLLRLGELMFFEWYLVLVFDLLFQLSMWFDLFGVLVFQFMELGLFVFKFFVVGVFLVDVFGVKDKVMLCMNVDWKILMVKVLVCLVIEIDLQQ